MRFGLGQIDTIPGDLEGNAAAMTAVAQRAVRAGAEVLVFPELSLCGYSPKDLLSSPSFVVAVERAEVALARALPAALHVIAGSIAAAHRRTGPPLDNVAVHLHAGTIAGRIAKRLIPNYDVFDEARYFAAGDGPRCLMIDGRRIGVTICEDMWSREAGSPAGARHYSEDPVGDAVRDGAEIVVNLSASPYDVGKPERRERLARHHARLHGRPFVLCNLVGGNDDLVFDGSSLALDAKGRTLVRCASFAADLAVCDPEAVGAQGERPAVDPHGAEATLEIHQALVLGIRDYAAKSGFGGAVIGLSGGIDSCVVAALAAEALGASNVLGVAMPSRYSASYSQEDAGILAANLGMGFDTVPIHRLHDLQLAELTPHFAGRAADHTEENLQARTRGLILMALSNKFGSLLLATGNKSEAAMGYCTLYGDTCGGLAPLGDLVKRRVYAAAHLVNSRSRDTIPARAITRPPSAELAPDQRDTDSLPPYEILDDIVERAVEAGQNVAEIVAAGHEPSVVRRVLQQMWRNEYKRRQTPHAIRVTAKAFGSGRRLPIAGARFWFESTDSARSD